MAPKQRLSLVERQQLLLEEKGFSRSSKPPSSAATAAANLSGITPHERVGSKGSAASGGSEKRRGSGTSAASTVSTSATQMTFMERHEALLVKNGRANATSLGRVAAPMILLDPEEGEDGGDGTASVASRASKAPSLHPSMAGSTYSLACSEVTVGAGDDTGYWDFQHRKCEPKDLAHTCRECKLPFRQLGEPITERRGARTSTRYHAECFSGYADPRSQCRSSHHEGHLSGSQLAAAPQQKCGTKMRTGCHFEGKSGRIAASISDSMGGKFGGVMGMGSNNFGSKSSKNQGTPMAEPRRAPGGFTEEELAAFDAEQGSKPPGSIRFSLGSIEEVEPPNPEPGPDPG